MELDEIKLYLRIDGEDEDMLLMMNQTVAEEYLKDAGIIQNYNKATYKMAVLEIMKQLYERNSIDCEALNPLINQLQLGV